MATQRSKPQLLVLGLHENAVYFCSAPQVSIMDDQA
jgi:hypothetical protein